MLPLVFCKTVAEFRKIAVPSCSGSIKFVTAENENRNEILASLSDNKNVHRMTKIEAEGHE